MKKTALITGGSEGIGFEIAKRFAKNGYDLLIVALSGNKLETAQNELQTLFPEREIKSLGINLAEAEAPEKTYQWTKNQPQPIDVLINNAGFGTFGFAHETDIDRELSMLQLNVVCVYKLTRFFLADMIEKNDGTIINISSNSSFAPIPKLAAYASTKAFVSHYSRALSEELKMQQSAVRVLTVCPSAIQDTNFKNAGKMENLKTFEGLAFTTKKEVADDVWKAFQNKQSYLITGRKMRWAKRLQNLLPYSLNQFFIRLELKEKG